MKGNIIYKKTIPARSPEYAEFPKSLHPDIQDFLSGQKSLSIPTRQKLFPMLWLEKIS